MFLRLAVRSLLDRKGTICLSLIAMTVSIFVLLSVEHIRFQIKESFSSTLSGVDIVVGAKTGDLNLLLYSVFRLGRPTSNVSWQSFEKFAKDSRVRWAIPLALGDSHKGFPVLGTNMNYFNYYSFGEKRKLVLEKGKVFENLLDVVLGSEVAKKLNYRLGDNLVIAHGLSEVSFISHDEAPFRVVGILKPTGTPVDRTLHVRLEAIESIHNNYGVRLKNDKSLKDEALIKELFIPESITAFLIGLHSKLTTFQLRQEINDYPAEPLIAVLPGVALSELWQIMGLVENSLFFISVLIFVSACLGVSGILLASIRDRIREIHLLRAIGAPPIYIFCLLELEAFLITLVSIILAICLVFLTLQLFDGFLVSQLGLVIEKTIFSEISIVTMGVMLLTSQVTGFIPAAYAFMKSTE